MADFRIYINCDNASFYPDPGYQISKILNTLADELIHGSLDHQINYELLDLNGNSVGRAAFHPDIED